MAVTDWSGRAPGDIHVRDCRLSTVQQIPQMPDRMRPSRATIVARAGARRRGRRSTNRRRRGRRRRGRRRRRANGSAVAGRRHIAWASAAIAAVTGATETGTKTGATEIGTKIGAPEIGAKTGAIEIGTITGAAVTATTRLIAGAAVTIPVAAITVICVPRGTIVGRCIPACGECAHQHQRVHRIKPLLRCDCWVIWIESTRRIVRNCNYPGQLNADDLVKPGCFEVGIVVQVGNRRLFGAVGRIAQCDTERRAERRHNAPAVNHYDRWTRLPKCCRSALAAAAVMPLKRRHRTSSRDRCRDRASAEPPRSPMRLSDR